MSMKLTLEQLLDIADGGPLDLYDTEDGAPVYVSEDGESNPILEVCYGGDAVETIVPWDELSRAEITLHELGKCAYLTVVSECTDVKFVLRETVDVARVKELLCTPSNGVILLVTCKDGDGTVAEDARLYRSKAIAEKWLAGYVDLLMEVHHHGVGDDGSHRHTDGRTYFESTYEGRISRYTFKMYDLSAQDEDWNLIKDTSNNEKDEKAGILSETDNCK